jgi:hypothetical protein
MIPSAQPALVASTLRSQAPSRGRCYSDPSQRRKEHCECPTDSGYPLFLSDLGPAIGHEIGLTGYAVSIQVELCSQGDISI